MGAMSQSRTAHLQSRAVIAVSGPEWKTFLNGLLTPQGRLLYDLFVAGLEDGALLDVASEHRDAILMRLTMYKLRAKVELAASDLAVFAAWPATAGDFADPRLPALGSRAYAAEQATTATEDTYEAHRLALGVPGPSDWGTDKLYPIDADFDLLAGIDFKKGCFVGQETTSRMKRRGVIKNRMLPITFDGPAPAFGAQVLAGTLRAGEVLSGRDGRAMALLRLDRIEGADLTVDDRPVSVDRPEWLPA